MHFRGRQNTSITKIEENANPKDRWTRTEKSESLRQLSRAYGVQARRLEHIAQRKRILDDLPKESVSKKADLQNQNQCTFRKVIESAQGADDRQEPRRRIPHLSDGSVPAGNVPIPGGTHLR